MSRTRKPQPATQAEISKEVIPEQAVFSTNRSEKLSMRKNNSKEFNIGLEDIDKAVFHYFNEVIKPYVIQNGERVVVPIIYSSPENWKSYQKDGYYRDKNGAIMLPIIAIKRDSIQKDRTVSNKMDANHPNLYSSSQKIYNKNNAYSNFNILNNRIPVKQYNVTVIPSYIIIEYSCIIQTYYVEQLNKIIEAIEYSSDSYWGDPERFKFRAFIDRFSTIVESSAEQERSAKSNFTIRLRGYIIPETLQKDLTAVKYINSKSKVTIDTIVVSDINQIN